MSPFLSFKRQKIAPPAVSPASARRIRGAGKEEAIMAMWYMANKQELKMYACQRPV